LTLAVAWVWNQAEETFLAAGPSYTATLNAVVAVGNHVIVHGMRRRDATLITAVTCSKGDAVVSIDHAGGGLTDWSHGVASVYFPTGAPALTTVTLTWGASTAFNYAAMLVDEYVGIATSAWVDTTANASNAFGDAPDSGLAAPSTADGLVLGAILGLADGSAFTPGSGFVIRSIDHAYDYGLMVCEDKQGVSGNQYRANGLFDQYQGWSAIVVNYKGSGGGPPPAPDAGDSRGRWDPNMRAPS
jgi:hypothetical protein